MAYTQHGSTHIVGAGGAIRTQFILKNCLLLSAVVFSSAILCNIHCVSCVGLCVPNACIAYITHIYYPIVKLYTHTHTHTTRTQTVQYKFVYAHVIICILIVGHLYNVYTVHTAHCRARLCWRRRRQRQTIFSAFHIYFVTFICIPPFHFLFNSQMVLDAQRTECE